MNSFRHSLSSILMDKSALFGAIVLIAWVAVSLFGPLLTTGDPNEQDLASTLLPPIWLDGGSSAYLLGTDQLGRDVLLRTLYGARSSLILGLSAVALTAVLGCSVALLAAELGGIADDVLMRVADVQLSIPFILLAISLLMLLGASLGNMVLVLVLSGWVNYARVVRSELLYLRELDFVLAARASGAGGLRIAIRHLLPNVLGLVVVIATLQLAEVVILAAALSFLGLGLQAPAISWGGMLADGRDYLTTAWWISTVPGLAITCVILGVNIVGDWLRDVLDPHSKGRT